MKNKGFVVWLTGLPGSGKTTMANLLKEELSKRGLAAEILDGDEVRKNLSPELGFTKENREVHARRVAYVAKLLSRNGIITIVALISPYRSFREYARNLIGNFIEVWVNCSVEECARRDPKGLYKKAKEGKISDLTGPQADYEPPLRPELVVETDKLTREECIDRIIYRLKKLDYL